VEIDSASLGKLIIVNKKHEIERKFKMKYLRNFLTVAVLLSALVIVGCSDDNNSTGPNVPTMNIVETAIDAGDFTVLVAAVQAAGLVDLLTGDEELTVFAPTDDAFAALPDGTIDALLADPETLASILAYHVVSGSVIAEQVVTFESVETLNGQSATITVDNDGSVMIDNANIIVTDILTTNGIIHVIDAVILPS
jgi:uncharacterized surface protein with fasciclin (FAS1) repeats